MIRDRYGRFVDMRVPEVRVVADTEADAVAKLKELAKYLRRDT